MQAAPMISYAQNREDVVLWRALHQVEVGRYAEIAADDGTDASSTRVLADHGWAGVVLVPNAIVAAARRDGRPHERVEIIGEAGAVAGADDQDGDLHLLVVDTGDRAGSLRPGDLPLLQQRPWVVVVVSGTGPDDASVSGDWDAALQAAGYGPCLFDGVSRFYLAPGHDDLRARLSYPACARDEFTDRREAELTAEVARLEAAVREARDESLDELLRWRHAAVTTWAKTAATRASGATPKEYQQLQVALAAAQRDAAEVRQTLSWRVTKPLRMVKSAGRR